MMFSKVSMPLAFKLVVEAFVRALLVLLISALPVQLAVASATGLVVTGIGGNPEYEEQFKQQGEVVVEALRSIGKSDEDFILLQSEDATREAVLDAIASLAGTSAEALTNSSTDASTETSTDASTDASTDGATDGATDASAQNNITAFYLILLGHGTVDAESWRFNLKGDDLTTEDLVSSLAAISTEQQIVVLGTSASGAVLDILSQPGRHLITATKSGGELNAVRFPEFFAKAMETTVADIDRNEILTLAELYRYTNEQTQNYYEDQKLLASEHARIVSDQPERIAVARLGSLRTANDDPVVAALLEQRLELEDAFLAIKAKKDDLPVVDYYAELEEVLISIALLQQDIDAATGWVNTNE